MHSSFNKVTPSYGMTRWKKGNTGRWNTGGALELI